MAYNIFIIQKPPVYCYIINLKLDMFYFIIKILGDMDILTV